MSSNFPAKNSDDDEQSDQDSSLHRSDERAESNREPAKKAWDLQKDYFENEESTARASMVQNIILVATVSFAVITWIWTASDITGEYGSSSQITDNITLSIVRKATTIHSNLYFGQNALLEYNGPSVSSGQKLHWTFNLPEKWIEQGQKPRTVVFDGQVENGIAFGTIIDHGKKTQVKLIRNGIASMYRLMQSHLPWAY